MKTWDFKNVKNNLKAYKIYIDNIEYNRSVKIESNTELFSFEILSFKLNLK